MSQGLTTIIFFHYKYLIFYIVSHGTSFVFFNMSGRKSYTDAQKAAYYRRRAAAGKPKKKYSASKTVRTSNTRRLRGHGDYSYDEPGPFGKVGRLLGGGLGQMVGGSTGREIGEKVGGLAHWIGKLFGSGDYKMGENPDYNVLTNAHQIPQFSSSKMTNMVCHREYIQDIISSATPGAFNLQSFDINAGLAASFPWLSNLAQNYEQYKVHGMVFEFRTMSADALNSTNTALGQVIMACEYNSANPNFINKQQMENYEYAISCKPSESAYCAVECAKNQTPVAELYVRGHAVPSGQDQRLYDLGNFQIATNGLQGASVNVGELWVTFCVELLKPRLFGGTLGDAILTAHINLSTSIAVTTGYLIIHPTLADYDGIGLLPFTTATTLNFPANIIDGTYMIVYTCKGNSTAAVVGPTITATSGCSAFNMYDGEAASAIVLPSATSTIAITTKFIKITSGGAIVTFSGGTFPNVISSGDLYVCQLPGDIT
nr:putative capsid protein [Crucivirus sp.]